MDQESLPVKPWKLWTAMFLLMVLSVHLVAETAVQMLFGTRSGVAKYLAEFRGKAEKDGLTLEQYAKKIGLDAYLGWGGNEVRIHEPKAVPAKPRTVLFLGDSVTAGHDVVGGVEDYPALLANTLGAQGVSVVNLAARGYGVDQMWLKLLTKAGAYRPDMIVLAYIPHDLLRPAHDFNFGLPKPRFQFDGPQAKLVLAQGIADYMHGFESARSWFHLNDWYVSHYVTNKEYYLPGVFPGYYRRLFRHIGEGLARISEEWGIPVRVVKLTNFHGFGGSETLVRLAAEELARPTVWGKANVGYVDTDGCVAPKAKALSMDVEQEFAHHPGPAGHRLLAECLAPAIDAALGLP